MAGDWNQNLAVKQTRRAAKVPLLRKMVVLCSLGTIILIASWVYNRKTGLIGSAGIDGDEYAKRLLAVVYSPGKIKPRRPQLIAGAFGRESYSTFNAGDAAGSCKALPFGLACFLTALAFGF